MPTFRAVVAIAQEVRFINEQANLGFIELTEKLTTIAINKFKNDRLRIIEMQAAEGPSEGTTEITA